MAKGKSKSKRSSTKKKTKGVALRPLDDRIVVQRVDSEETTSGGIVLPDSAREKPQVGTVVAVGPGKLNDDGERTPVEVKAGDKVLFSKYGGTDVTVDDQDYLILRESDLLAIQL